MASQAEVIQYLTKTYDHERLDGGFFKIVLTGEGRSQLVFAFVGENFMMVDSPFAPKTSISADQALNANNSIFGVGVFGDLYTLKHAVPIADLDESEIYHAINGISGVADELEKSLGLGDNL